MTKTELCANVRDAYEAGSCMRCCETERHDRRVIEFMLGTFQARLCFRCAREAASRMMELINDRPLRRRGEARQP